MARGRGDIRVTMTAQDRNASRNVRRFRDEVSSTGTAARTTARSIGTLVGAIGGLEVMRRAIKTGLDFNAVIEQARFGIAALLMSANDYQDSMGKSVGPVRAFNAALGQSAGAMKQLRQANLQTAATLPELIVMFQEAQAVAGRFGEATEKNMVRLTKSFSQLGSIMQIPQFQMGEEIRSVLTGVMRSRITRVAPFVSSQLGTDLTGANKILRGWREQGVIISKVLDLLKDMDVLGKQAENTWFFVMSNLKDSVQGVLGEGFKPLFEYLKQNAKTLQESMIVRTPEGLQIAPGTPRVLQAISKEIIRLSESIRDFIDAIPKPGTDPMAFTATWGMRAAEIYILGRAVRFLGPLLRGLGRRRISGGIRVLTVALRSLSRLRFGRALLALRLLAAGPVTMGLGLLAAAGLAIASNWKKVIPVFERVRDEWGKLSSALKERGLMGGTAEEQRRRTLARFPGVQGVPGFGGPFTSPSGTSTYQPGGPKGSPLFTPGGKSIFAPGGQHVFSPIEITRKELKEQIDMDKIRKEANKEIAAGQERIKNMLLEVLRLRGENIKALKLERDLMLQGKTAGEQKLIKLRSALLIEKELADQARKAAKEKIKLEKQLRQEVLRIVAARDSAFKREIQEDFDLKKTRLEGAPQRLGRFLQERLTYLQELKKITPDPARAREYQRLIFAVNDEIDENNRRMAERQGDLAAEVKITWSSVFTELITGAQSLTGVLFNAVRIMDSLKGEKGILGMIGRLAGPASMGAGIGGLVGGLTGQSGLGSSIGGSIGGILGKMGGQALTGFLPESLVKWAGPVGMAVGAVGGSLLGGLFGGGKKDRERAAIRNWVSGTLRPALALAGSEMDRLTRQGFTTRPGNAFMEMLGPPFSTGKFKKMGFSGGVPQQMLAEMMAWLDKMQKMASTMKNMMKEAFRDAFGSVSANVGYERFLRDMRRSIADYVKEGMIKGLVQGSAFSKAIAPIVQESRKLALKFGRGKIGQEEFNAGIQAIMGTQLPILERLFSPFEGVFAAVDSATADITGQSPGRMTYMPIHIEKVELSKDYPWQQFAYDLEGNTSGSIE